MGAVPEHDSAFTDQQYADIYPEGIQYHFWYVARNAIVSNAIRWIERLNQASVGRMLEVGCGRGIVVEHLRGTGCDCYGAELAPVAIPGALKDYVWSGTDCLMLPSDFRNKVELILLLDVIEHIEDPVGFLATIRRAYPNCQWLIVSVPARMELWSSFDERYGHFRRYDGPMLRDEIERAGADLIYWRYRFTLLYPLIYTLLRTGKGRALSNRAPRFRFLHRIIGEVLLRETWLCSRRVYGTSIVGIARFRDHAPRVVGESTDRPVPHIG